MGDMVKMEFIEDATRQIRGASSLRELGPVTTSALQRAGFSGLTYLEVRDGRFELHHCTYSPTWMHRYQEKDYGLIDPAIKRMFTEDSAFAWAGRDFIGGGDKKLSDFFDDALVHGIAQGISIPIKRGNNIRLFSVVTPDTKRSIDEWKTAVSLVAQQFHMRFIALWNEERIGGSSLSERESQILFLSAVGATCQEMGELLGITKRTAEQHIASAKDKLGGRNQNAVISSAIDSGIVRLKGSGFSQFAEPEYFRMSVPTNFRSAG